MANGQFGGGNGSTTAPYLVEDYADVQAVRNRVSAHYRQTQDIDFEGKSHSPISGFTGSYEGDGFKIKNAYMNRTIASATYYIGFFGKIEAPSVIQNVHLENCNFGITLNGSGSVYFGNIVGYVEGGSINNCSFSGTMTCTGTTNGTKYFGGIIGGGQSRTVIKNCRVDATITATAPYSYVCGIGYMSEPYNCHFSGKITGTNDVAGMSDGSCFDCSVTNATIETTVGRAAGISYYNDATRCSVANSSISGEYSVSGIGNGSCRDCSIINSSITSNSTSASYTACGISIGANSVIARCLVKDCTIKGPNAVGINGHYDSSNSTIVTDSAVIGGTITATHSSGYAIGILYNRYSNSSPRVERCYCSANITTIGPHLSGIMSTYNPTNSTSSYVKNSFYLGQYLKGLGARTSNVGFICAIPQPGNANNYALDTAQIILE